MKRSIGALSILAFFACATVPAATGPLDWAAVADVSTPVIVTVDPDGDVRDTKLWLVVVDGQGYIRTSETRWFRNIERDPNVVLRIGGAAYPLRAKLVMDPELRARINAAFYEKYWMERLLLRRLMNREEANMLRLIERNGK